MKKSISFCYEDELYYTTLDEGHVITIGSGLLNHLQVPHLLENQFTLRLTDNQIYFSGIEPYQIENYKVKVNQPVFLNKKHRMFLYASDIYSEYDMKVELPLQGEVSLGRDSQNTIVTALDYMSRRHMTFTCKEGITTLKNLSQSNGTFVNGKRVEECVLKPGDVISVFTLRIVYYSHYLSFENCEKVISTKDTMTMKDNMETKTLETGRSFHRSPRIQSQLPQESILLSPPPNKGSKYQKSRNMFMQLLSTGTMLASTMVMSGAASPAFLAARAMSLIMPVANIGMQKSMDKKRKKQLEEYEKLRKELYGKYIEEQKARIEEVALNQRTILANENPSPKECVDFVETLNPQLWERTSMDRDFLDVRLGMGYEKLCVEVKGGYNEQNFQMEHDEIKDIANEIIKETEYVDHIPTRLHLREFNSIGLIGDRQRVLNEVRNMIVSLSATHFYKDVKIVGIFDECDKKFFESIRWLPHVFDDEKQSRYLAFNKKEADVLCERLNDMLENRKRQLSDNTYKQSYALPHYIFILGSKRYVKDQLMMQNLLLNRKEMGISTLFLFDELYELPQSCQFIVDMNEQEEGNFACGYERDKINQKFIFSLDDYITDSEFDIFARSMSAIHVDGFASKSDVPDSVTFLQGYNVEKVEELESDKRWRIEREDETLAAPIGVMSGGRLFSLDAYEKGHGPHGLLAGTTGSGKSELLQSWILSLAVNYHPHDVAFVLVDYKGGGMSGQFDNLPHVIGEITNIGEGIDRAFIALESENLRREAIFKKYDVNSLAKYHKLYRNGQASEILPHLIIVVDEFAMMKKEKPDSIARLVKIATVGRSLGIHLLLATQSPGGVVDELIKNNSNFNLCLKVQSASDSRDLLKTPDAANLRTVGRAYVRVGNNEVYEMFQSFWSGAPYFTNGVKPVDSVNRVRVVTMDGTRKQVTETEKKKVHADSDELREIVKYLSHTAKNMNIKKVDSLWMPELPGYLPLNELGRNCGFDGKRWRRSEKWLRVPIGKYDLPIRQTQGVQYIDFAKDGHLGIYGSPQSGKTNLIKTIVYSAGLNFTPEEVSIYGIDCGGGSTSILGNMPHVGGIARDSETEKIEKLEKMLRAELNNRKQIFLKNNVNSLEDYREAVSHDMGAILFYVDNLPALLEFYPDMEEFLVGLAREGSAYGIYFIFSANTVSSVKFKIAQNIKNAIAFELNDRGDYTGIVGRPSHLLPAIKGRAFVKGLTPVMIQASLYMEGDNELVRSRNLLKVLDDMNEAYQGKKPKKIPVMPESIPMSDMIPLYKETYRIPLGLSYEDMEGVFVDLSSQYTFVVSGSARVGKSRFLENMASFLKQKDTKLYIFDGLKRSLAECEEYADGYSICSDDKKMEELVNELVNELNQRRRELKSSMSDLDFDETTFASKQKPIVIMIDETSEFIQYVNETHKKKIRLISKQAKSLGVMIFVAGRLGSFEQLYESEPIVYDWIESQHGLILSGTLGSHSFFKNSLGYAEKSYELKEGEAYLVDNGEVTKIKPAG